VTSLDLYPAVELPVSTSTPMLSSLVHWDHTDSWPVPAAADFFALGSTGSNGDSCSSNVEVDVSGSRTVLFVFSISTDCGHFAGPRGAIDRVGGESESWESKGDTAEFFWKLKLLKAHFYAYNGRQINMM